MHAWTHLFISTLGCSTVKTPLYHIHLKSTFNIIVHIVCANYTTFLKVLKPFSHSIKKILHLTEKITQLYGSTVKRSLVVVIFTSLDRPPSDLQCSAFVAELSIDPLKLDMEFLIFLPNHNLVNQFLISYSVSVSQLQLQNSFLTNLNIVKVSISQNSFKI